MTSPAKKSFMTPEEFMKIQLRKQQLQKRLLHQQQKSKSQPNSCNLKDNFKAFAVTTSQKRLNPFIRESEQVQKRSKGNDEFQVEDTIFELIHSTKSKVTPNLEAPTPDEIIKQATEYILSDDEESNQKPIETIISVPVLPIDWSIKSKVRIMASSQIISSTLSSGVKASGVTGFVRCLDITTTNSGLDTSHSSRFHQNEMFWQYPHIPWLNLIQRNASSNNEFKINEKEADELFKDWVECFMNLFQLLRARQCPYFYLLSNHFGVLFRAAGIGGRVETHAILTPTTKGFRKILKKEDIEFTQPLKDSSRKSTTPNTSLEDVENKNPIDGEVSEEEDEVQFLANLGVNTSDIKLKEDIKARQKELEDDNGDLSSALFEGSDCQAFANYLLEAKSTIPKVGRLAGVPPTLVSPVAFLGSSLRRQKLRCSKIRENGIDMHSVEITGAILPHTIHTLTSLLSEMKESYNMTMTNYTTTVAFTKTSRKLLEDLDTSQANADQIFGRENLSDSGLSNSVLEAMCRTDKDAVNFLEKLQYNREMGGFTIL